MAGQRLIRVGVIGLGFIGRTHVAAFEAARRDGLPCRVVAVCDRRRDAGSGEPVSANTIGGSVEAALGHDVARCTDPARVLDDPDIDLVSVCTYTDTHAPLAIRALRAGKHVLVEKPVALRAADIEPVARAARETGRLCMPAFCMRFWPGWDWLEQQVASRAFGGVRSAVFQRLASRPAWSAEFYRDYDRTGGAICDLHIHDADVVRWLFGDPLSVTSAGSLDHITTLYRYGPGGPPHVVAEGGWDHAPGFAFRMRYVVVFDEATAEYDSTRPSPLTLIRGGRAEDIAVAPHTGWEGEIRRLVETLAAGRTDPGASIDDAWATARLLECERRSAETGAVVNL
ncbi:MAG: Gfo/Idh/MocA family oxidoreductase [Phycisphaerae bacterium]|nr:Gfo/Idh/MocA family oxidoreductase [Phycisphaerae bacterium]MCZ2399482.1 Gfo/Idh/MocA family oxidoreductase [Phycisphaerae bacterium]